MKKLILYLLCLTYGLGACMQEPTLDFSPLSGIYEGYVAANYCTGNPLTINISNKNRVVLYAQQCYNKSAKFEGYHIEKSKSDSAIVNYFSSKFKIQVAYTLIEDKTGEEVGYFKKDPFPAPLGEVWIWFYGNQLISTGKDTLFACASRATIKK